MFIHQQPHQFGHDAGRVCVIELKVIFRSKVFEILAMPPVPVSHDILKTRGSQEILLAQAQFLAIFAGIIRVKHHGDMFGVVLGGDRFRIAPCIEFAQVELVGRSRMP